MYKQKAYLDYHSLLTHWGRVTHICVSKLTIIASDNGLSPDRRQTIIWTNAGLLLIEPLVTNFSETLIKILIFSFKKMRLKVSSAKRRPFCLNGCVNGCCPVWHDHLVIDKTPYHPKFWVPVPVGMMVYHCLTLLSHKKSQTCNT